jgi:hypothetical protein
MACLLRHEREAHAMHGHGEKPFLCNYEGCNRGVSGHGFKRQWNLRGHIKRVHTHPGLLNSGGGNSDLTLPGLDSRGEKRRADSPAIVTPDLFQYHPGALFAREYKYRSPPPTELFTATDDVVVVLLHKQEAEKLNVSDEFGAWANRLIEVRYEPSIGGPTHYIWGSFAKEIEKKAKDLAQTFAASLTRNPAGRDRRERWRDRKLLKVREAAEVKVEFGGSKPKVEAPLEKGDVDVRSEHARYFTKVEDNLALGQGESSGFMVSPAALRTLQQSSGLRSPSSI